MRAGTDMTTTPNPLMTPFDRKKAAAIGLRKWVRFASDGETTIMQVRNCAWPASPSQLSYLHMSTASSELIVIDVLGCAQAEKAYTMRPLLGGLPLLCS